MPAACEAQPSERAASFDQHMRPDRSSIIHTAQLRARRAKQGRCTGAGRSAVVPAGAAPAWPLGVVCHACPACCCMSGAHRWTICLDCTIPCPKTRLQKALCVRLCRTAAVYARLWHGVQASSSCVICVHSAPCLHLKLEHAGLEQAVQCYADVRL